MHVWNVHPWIKLYESTNVSRKLTHVSETRVEQTRVQRSLIIPYLVFSTLRDTNSSDAIVPGSKACFELRSGKT